jgi:hypothetical protein
VWCGPWDAVLFTGDLVQSGESAQFKEMQTEVLDPLWRTLPESLSMASGLNSLAPYIDVYVRSGEEWKTVSAQITRPA